MDTRTTESHRSTRGEPIASCDNYADAVAAVDKLADRHFAVEHLSIVGRDLVVEEDVARRRGYVRAAADTAANGAFTGAFVGFILGIFSVVEPLVSGLVLMLVGALIGALLGGAVGVMAHVGRRGRPDFSSVSMVRAESYDVVADLEVANHARSIFASP